MTVEFPQAHDFPALPPISKLARAGTILRVAGHVLREYLTRPVPNAVPEIPRSAQTISPQWLTSVLCARTPGAAVTDVKITGRSNGTTNRANIRLTYNSEGVRARLPNALFVKSTATFTTRVLNGLSGIIEGETGFYNLARPDLDIEAPLSYYSDFDQQSWRSIVLLDDIVTTKGATVLTTRSEISIEQMKGLLKTLAKCHGAYYDSPKLDHDFTWLKTPLDFQLTTNASLDFRRMSDRGAFRARPVIPEALWHRGDDIWSAFARSLQLNAQGTRCLLHGDSHIRNFYKTASNEMGALDWQITMKGHWAFDFAYIVISGLTVDNRRLWEKSLLAYYLEELALAGGPAPSFDEAWLAYRQHTIYPYYGFLVVVGAGALLPDMQPIEACMDIIGRAANAIVDLDSFEALGITRNR